MIQQKDPRFYKEELTRPNKRIYETYSTFDFLDSSNVTLGEKLQNKQQKERSPHRINLDQGCKKEGLSNEKEVCKARMIESQAGLGLF